MRRLKVLRRCPFSSFTEVAGLHMQDLCHTPNADNCVAQEQECSLRSHELKQQIAVEDYLFERHLLFIIIIMWKACFFMKKVNFQLLNRKSETDIER
mmetsp:Transcript_29608/g.62374  ORF Transcript_29608/g.62374 Transcript_29608/m.62374 type:complete len:97 (-) Transcript_29608:42-332(-)